MKKCFIISPIGQPGSDARQQADDVLEYIIRPALRELEVEAVRGDHFSEPGLITDQVIEAILTYDFCIVDISGHNPNVFYELAIAQTIRRPVVFLKLAGEPIPFDVKDYRLIEYDLKPRSIMTNKWIPVLKAQISAILKPNFVAPPLPGSESLNTEKIRSYIANVQSKELGIAPKYHEVANSAEKYCYLMGVSLKVWRLSDGKRVLASLAERVPVRVLIMHPNNPGLQSMINPQLSGQRLDALKMDIQEMEESFRSIAKLNPSFQFRVLEKGMPYFQLILTDKTALVLQYMFCRETQDSHLQYVPRQSELYALFLQ
jgi:putative hemolysin